MGILISSYPDVRVLRAALGAGAVAGLVVLAACTESSTSVLTFPQAPRTATIGSGGFGQAKTLTLCVDASSPAGTYTFHNIALNRGQGGPPPHDPTYTFALDGNGFWDGSFWNDNGDGGDGTTVANADVNVNYPVTPGPSGCVVVLNRTVGDAAFMAVLPINEGGTCDPNAQACGGKNDSFAAANFEPVSNTAGAVYDHTDCFIDDGTPIPQHINPTTGNPPVATQPWPQGGFDHNNPPAYTCGSNNFVTRAFVNYEHGVTVTYAFNTPVQSTALIAPTATTCEDYSKNTAATLGEIDAGFHNTKVNSMSPGVFFYYAHVTKGAGQSVSFGESLSPNAGNLPPYVIQQGQAYLYTFASGKCTTVATLTLSSGGTGASGGSALPAGNYVLGVKYATDAPKVTVVANSSLRTSGALLATENFIASVNGSTIATTAASVDTKAK